MASWPFQKNYFTNDQLHWGLVFLEKANGNQNLNRGAHF